jgi:hypothetical protein
VLFSSEATSAAQYEDAPLRPPNAMRIFLFPIVSITISPRIFYDSGIISNRRIFPYAYIIPSFQRPKHEIKIFFHVHNIFDSGQQDGVWYNSRMISDDIKFYPVKSKPISGSNYRELLKIVRAEYKYIAKQTKRTAYIRSEYFKKDKIFLSLYWIHLSETPMYAQRHRLKLFKCGIELLRHTTFPPETKPNPNGRNELVYRFGGKTPDGQKFYVHVKQEIRSGKKYFMSAFPERK